MKNHLKIIIVLLATTAIIACKKEFLEKKPNKLLVVPKSLADFQALLDNKNMMNNSASIQILSADNFYTKDDGLLKMKEAEKNAYSWNKNLVMQTNNDWSTGYITVFYSNVVLDGLNNIVKDNINEKHWNTLKGSALFYRAFAFYNLAQVFANGYDSKSATNSLGIPLRLSADINLRPARGTVQDTYDQILKDLHEAKDLLYTGTDYITKPSKEAVLALLARTYQTMGDYSNAEIYADQTLAIKSNLINYNEINQSLARPFSSPIPNQNSEILFYAEIVYSAFIYNKLNRIPDELYQSYDLYDLRKGIFFTNPQIGNINFKGTYTGTNNFFGGIAIDEMFLIKAECLARRDKTQEAMDKLNALLIKRWQTDKFLSASALNSTEALKKILLERRKELISRGLRWTDLRRLNQEKDLAVTLKRIINGNQIELPPLDIRYTLPIPQDEIMYSGIKQNDR